MEEYRHFNFPWSRTNWIRKLKYFKCQTWEMANSIKLYYVLPVLTIMRNAMQLKGNKLAAVSRHSWNLSTFLFDSKKCHNKKYQIWFFMRISKWGLPLLYPLYLKKQKNATFVRLSDYFSNITQRGHSFQNFITLSWLCLNLFAFIIPKQHWDLALTPIGHWVYYMQVWYHQIQVRLGSS